MDDQGGERGGGGGGGGRILGLIEKATTSTAREVDPRLLKAIKSMVRYSDLELRLAAETLTDLMKRDHSQVRYLSLLIIDELFMRSKLFRTLMVENLDQLLSLSVGFRKNMPLPAPPAIATLLRSKAIECLEKWNMSFGFHYRQLRLGYDYLKNTLRFQFPNLQANASRIQQERREREMRTKEILINKFESLREDFSSIKDEIEETVKEIEECLEIVQPKEDGDVPLSILDEEDFEEFRSSHLRQIRLDSLRESEKVHETNENKVVFDALREQYKLLITKHLAAANEWTSILIRVEATDTKLRDTMLKEFIDIRNLILAVKKKCEEAGCSLSENRDKDVAGEEDFWEDSKIGIEATEDIHPSSRSKNVAESSMASTSFNTLSSTLDKEAEENNRRGKNVAESSMASSACNTLSSSSKSQSSKSLDREAEENDTDPTRRKLLSEAPVVDWGPDLSNWGSSSEVLANARGLDLESYWGRVDPDAVIPADKIAELNLRATIYTEAEVEIQPCRAPLKKGGLCQRRDIRICPFHGPIIPRDDEGNPIKQNSLMDEETNLESDISERLAKQAVENIRGKDKAELRKRVIDKQSAKRAKREKLAKIREHNDAVLRDAALASTSRSAVIDDAEFERITTGRKEETLGSMLRKKVTTKDRLAQRLLIKRPKLT